MVPAKEPKTDASSFSKFISRELPGNSVSMKTTFVGTEVAKLLAMTAHHQANIKEIQLRTTKLRKSGVFSFSILKMFVNAFQPMALGFGLQLSSMISSANSVTIRPTVLNSRKKKPSARMPGDRALRESPRTDRQIRARSFTESSMLSFCFANLSSSSRENLPSAALSVLLRRQSLMSCTTFSRGSFRSRMTSTWLCSKPSRKTQICMTARRRSKSFSMPK
mmetsp:Transcript_100796/g.267937  ORF Transcript_100796/g.267937 Transcript_100796/m.267937 type:complete len:221 (-) Transcript_100796:395-1057(-)